MKTIKEVSKVARIENELVINELPYERSEYDAGRSIYIAFNWETNNRAYEVFYRPKDGAFVIEDGNEFVFCSYGFRETIIEQGYEWLFKEVTEFLARALIEDKKGKLPKYIEDILKFGVRLLRATALLFAAYFLFGGAINNLSNMLIPNDEIGRIAFGCSLLLLSAGLNDKIIE